MIPEIEAGLVAIARDEVLLEEQRFVPRRPGSTRRLIAAGDSLAGS